MANNSSDGNMTFLPPNAYDIFRIAAPELNIVDRVITPFFYLIGAIGNPLSAKIWLSRKARKSNPSAIYLGAIAVVDCAFLLLHVWMELLQAWGVKTFNRPVVCEIYNFLLMTPQYLAPLLILGFTFERYVAICFPFKKKAFCTVQKAVIGVFIFTIIALCLGSVQAYVWTYNAHTRNCEIRLGTFDFYSIWTWFSEMLIFLVVPLTVLIFNVLVIVEVKRISKFSPPGMQRHGKGPNQTSTITLLSVSFYLICTLLPATIVYAMQVSVKEGKEGTPPSEMSSDPTWTGFLTFYHIRRIIEEICLSNYACYVFIYYITSGFFRNEVRALLGLKNLNDKNKRAGNNTASTFVDHNGQTKVADMNVDVL